MQGRRAPIESLQIRLKSPELGQRCGARRLNASDSRGSRRSEAINAPRALDTARFVKAHEGGRQFIVGRDRVVDVIGRGDQGRERCTGWGGPIRDRKQHPGGRPGRHEVDGVAGARRGHGPTIPEHRSIVARQSLIIQVLLHRQERQASENWLRASCVFAAQRLSGPSPLFSQRRLLPRISRMPRAAVALNPSVSSAKSAAKKRAGLVSMRLPCDPYNL